ncbi:MAG: sensor histidine kinase [Lachnospiraceae bacterium]|uniref:sensor histidine kinase n=1 Tax=Parablautia sp. Marseille-Q6255 TaxID=3039593 RepID=UPI0024BCA0B3|nr:HAMP domain-containing sensor histidine kinase [Parablautia sp. Marseille-Q6255]
MRKQTIFFRIFLPTILVLLLLPPLSCLIFHHSAEKYAYKKAALKLDSLQQKITPLIEEYFRSDSDTDIVPNDSIPDFLFAIGSLMRKTTGSAKLMIFESRMHVIYPREEQERERLSPLSQDFAEYLLQQDDFSAYNTSEFESTDGHAYLINTYQVPSEFPQIKYIVVYSAISDIGDWIKDASIFVLIISSILMLLMFFVLLLIVRSITLPLHTLCKEASSIGSGKFTEIKPSFSLKELESLRLAMNQMSAQLLHSDKIQRNFFQNVSHELRNPLMSISGYAQGIEQRRFSAPEDAAHTILTESIRLTTLVNSLLTLSRLESETAPTKLEPLLIIDPIEACLDRCCGLALKNGITLSLLPFDEAVCVYGDNELICTILENFLTNAIRYAKTNVTISVTAAEHDLCISVADNGDGIAENDLPHLFERCYKGKGGIFGIGLAIAQSAAQKIGATLTASNAPSEGAIFTLRLQTP